MTVTYKGALFINKFSLLIASWFGHFSDTESASTDSVGRDTAHDLLHLLKVLQSVNSWCRLKNWTDPENKSLVLMLNIDIVHICADKVVVAVFISNDKIYFIRPIKDFMRNIWKYNEGFIFLNIFLKVISQDLIYVYGCLILWTSCYWTSWHIVNWRRKADVTILKFSGCQFKGNKLFNSKILKTI